MLPLTLTALLAAGAAQAAGGGVTVGLNGSVRVPFAGVAANVVVANPSVVDVTMIDAHSVVLIGKGYGATQILVTDRNGRTLMDRHVAVVGADESRVSYFRGPTDVEYDCTTRCEALSGSQQQADAASAAAAQSQQSASQTQSQAAVAAQPVSTTVQHAPM